LTYFSGGMLSGMALDRWLKDTKSILRPPTSVPLNKAKNFHVIIIRHNMQSTVPTDHTTAQRFWGDIYIC